MIKILALLLCTSVFGYEPECNKHTALVQVRRPTYEFAVRILDRVHHETKGHFVFSPLFTWLQLLALAEGADGKTLSEIITVTRYHRIKCFRKHVKEVFNSLEEELSDIAKHRSIIVIDKLLDVKESFKKKIEKLSAAKVLSLNFKNKLQSTAKLNEIIEMDLNGVITNIIDSKDFEMSVLFMADIAFLKADWRYPFNPVYTNIEPFYTDDKIISGQVNMMHQVGYFNYTYVPMIDAQALELPFNERVTMILLLPNKGVAGDLFWLLKDIRLMTVFNLFKTNGQKLVNVKMPRFNLTTDIDNIPELLHDMGMHTVFSPNLANLRKISDYKVFVSLMSNLVNIEVTEIGVTGSVRPENLIAPGDPTDFILNRPFVYLIVDKVTEGILFAGTYSKPSLY